MKHKFDEGSYNTIHINLDEAIFTFTPLNGDQMNGGQKRIYVNVFDRVARIATNSEYLCSFLCNYRGHILQTVPKRKKILK